MMNWKRNLLASTLVLTMALPVVALAKGAATNSNPAPERKAAMQSTDGFHVGEYKKISHGMKWGAHRQMYLTLLAEKYTPESVDQWKAAFAERTRLVQELKALREQEKQSESNKPIDQQKQELRQQFKQLADELHKKVKNGEITHEQMKQQLKEWQEKNAANMKNEKENKGEFKAIRQKFKQNREEFDAAIESADSEKIKAVLPKLLDEMKMVNKHLVQKLEKKKKETSPAKN